MVTSTLVNWNRLNTTTTRMVPLLVVRVRARARECGFSLPPQKQGRGGGGVGGRREPGNIRGKSCRLSLPCSQSVAGIAHIAS